jgi:hypothetical protein
MTNKLKLALDTIMAPGFGHLRTDTPHPDLDKICLICGEPFREHIVGGPGPYHPGTIKPDALG